MRVVALSDGRRFRVDAEQVARCALAPGEVVEDTLIGRLESRDLYLRAREAAVRLLAVRPRSTAELRVRLRQKRIPDLQIRAVVRDLTTAGYLDDLAFARAWITGRMLTRHYGIRRLRWELREKGVPAALIAQAIGEAFPEEGLAAAEQNCARAFIERRLPTYRRLPPDRQARRIAGLLQRRGFTPGTIGHILRTLGRQDLAEILDG